MQYFHINFVEVARQSDAELSPRSFSVRRSTVSCYCSFSVNMCQTVIAWYFSGGPARHGNIILVSSSTSSLCHQTSSSSSSSPRPRPTHRPSRLASRLVQRSAGPKCSRSLRAGRLPHGGPVPPPLPRCLAHRGRKKHRPPRHLTIQVSMDNPLLILLLYLGIYCKPRPVRMPK